MKKALVLFLSVAQVAPLLLVGLLIPARPARAQQGPLVPDCFITVTATTTVATLSVELDSANDTAGSPGAFAAFGGTLINGTNPNTSLNEGSAQVTGYFPWLRLRISGVTGSGINVVAFAFGYRPIAFFLQKASTVSSNITQLGGTNVFACPTQQPITLAATGNTQIIAHSGTNRTLICYIQVSWATGLDVQLQSGTGGTCGSGTANITGLMKNVATWTSPPGAFAPIVIAAGQDTCINDSTTAAGGGMVIYGFQP